MSVPSAASTCATSPTTRPSPPRERGESGTVTEWWAARENLPAAWDITRGDGARVAIIDTGVDGAHPELTNKIVATADFDDNLGDGPPTVDEDGHGTHVASLACAQPDNGIGIAGAGLGCNLLIAKSDLTESSVARALIWAADNGAEAINMSFGTDGRFAAAPAIVSALHYADGKGAVLVAAAADDPVLEQGDPANVLQPTDSGSDINQNLGLSITAANGADARASFAGRGTQISMAAYGTYGPGGPNGLLAAFPSQTTNLERGDPARKIAPCRCRTTIGDDTRYAYLPGTSMAAPQVAGVAALMRHLNPDLPPADVVRILKQTATRPANVAWTPELGWGILDAGSALAAARSVDAHAPSSQLQRPKVTGRSILLRWRGEDDAVAGVVASGVARYELWRSRPGRKARKIATTRAHSKRLRGKRGSLYRFFTIAVDNAGNRELPPAKADASVRVARRYSRRADPRRAVAARRLRGCLAPARQRQQLGQRRLDAVADAVEVGQRVVVAEQPEVHLPVVGHDRDRQRVALGQERDGEDVVHLAAPDVQRQLRARARW